VRGEGRFIVPLSPNGFLEPEIGETLKDEDDVPASRHTHPFIDDKRDGARAGIHKIGSEGARFGRGGCPAVTEVNERPKDTNAPYVQLLMRERI
jgi:hypothetical protein